MDNMLTAVVVLFGTALLAAWAMRVLRAPTILGFLLVGMLVGPSGLNLVREGADNRAVHFFAELGLVLLLFVVGLELSPTPLLRAGWRLVAAAGLQIGFTTAVAALVAQRALSLPPGPAVVLGLAVALSSTAIVLQHLSQRAEIDSPAGTLAAGVLLLQDIVVIVVLILLPLLAGAQAAGASWGGVLLRVGIAVAALVGVSVAARLLLPTIIELVFRFGGRELTTLFAIVMACMGAWLASLANWSWPLGSFIAGLLLAQTDLRHQLHAEITPFREAFNALFFISIGMLVELRLVVQHPGWLGGAVLATLLLKIVLTGGAVRLAGWPLRLALLTGLGLCTVSEFGYVLVREAVRLQVVSPQLLPEFVACAVGTMIVGSLLLPASTPLAAALSGVLRRGPGAALEQPRTGPALASHVIIVGYGLNGRNLATALRATRIPYVVVEMNRSTARRTPDDTAPLIIGDAARLAILARAGLATARALVVSIADQYATRRIVAQAHAARPDLYILARTRFVSELEPLRRLGAREVIPEEFETSIEIFAHVLREFGVPDNVIDQQVGLTRAGHYSVLRGRAATDRGLRREWLQLLEATVTQTFLVLEQSPAVGQTLRELDIRARTGVMIVAITRTGQPVPNPPADFRVEAGDVLVLVGTHQQLAAARASLEPPPSAGAAETQTAAGSEGR